jgi:hypothetical protein
VFKVKYPLEYQLPLPLFNEFIDPVTYSSNSSLPVRYAEDVKYPLEDQLPLPLFNEVIDPIEYSSNSSLPVRYAEDVK